MDKKGYISAPKVRGPDGKFAGSDLYMYITPKTENDPSAENPHVEKPMTDNPPEDKPHQGKPHAGHHRGSKSKESIIKESNNKRSMNQRYSGYQGRRKAPYNNFPQRENMILRFWKESFLEPRAWQEVMTYARNE